MALEWNLTDIEGIDEILEDDHERSILEALIYASITVGLGSITEDNVQTWAYRLWVAERLFGGIWVFEDGTRNLRASELRKYIGFKVNVADETDATWWERIAAVTEREYARFMKAESVRAVITPARSSAPAAHAPARVLED